MTEYHEKEEEGREPPPPPEPPIDRKAFENFERSARKEGGEAPAGEAGNEAARERKEGWDKIEGLDGDQWRNGSPEDRLNTLQEAADVDCDSRKIPHAEVRPGGVDQPDQYMGDPKNPVIEVDQSRLNKEYENDTDAAAGAAGALNAMHHEVDHYARDYEAQQAGTEKDAYLSPEQRAGESIGTKVDEEQRAGVSFGDDYYNWPDERKARESEAETSDYVRDRYGDEVADEFLEEEKPGPHKQKGRISLFNPEDNEEEA